MARLARHTHGSFFDPRRCTERLRRSTKPAGNLCLAGRAVQRVAQPRGVMRGLQSSPQDAIVLSLCSELSGTRLQLGADKVQLFHVAFARSGQPADRLLELAHALMR